MPIAYIGLGANVPGPAGPPEATMAAAAGRLAALGRVAGCSSLYSTEPVGFADQPRFLNAAVALETELSPRALLDALLAIERALGRDRAKGFANGPRPLDLDLLLYGDAVVSEHGLEVPHPRLSQRAFVLVPLHEIASQVRDPRTGATVSQYLEGLSRGSKGTNDEVVQVKGDLWRAGACGFAVDSGSPACADPGADPSHH